MAVSQEGIQRPLFELIEMIRTRGSYEEESRPYPRNPRESRPDILARMVI